MKKLLAIAIAGLGFACGVAATVEYGRFQQAGKQEPSKDEHGHDHGDHSHEGRDHAELTGVKLSDRARQNIGLEVGPVDPTDYMRIIAVPGVVVEQPGRSEIRVTTAVNGIVRKVLAFPGAAVRPGDPLLEIQLTGEALSTAQANLLRTLQEVELNEMEMKRITPLVPTGAVAEKTRLQLEYEQKRLASSRDVLMQELLVRGLSPTQIDQIIKTKQLIRDFTLVVPEAPDAPANAAAQEEPTVAAAPLVAAQKKNADGPVYVIERLDVYPGKLVQPGTELCELAHHVVLRIEGRSFEKESEAIGHANTHQWPVTAIFEVGDPKPLVRENLHILYLENMIDPTSRTFRFYLTLPNEVQRDNEGKDGVVYRTWRFKPGQKVELRVPIEEWKERFVVPAAAVVQEGPVAYVFRANGKLFEPQEVHVEYRDRQSVVLANDGALFPGDEIALNNAYQLQLAMKKSAGSGGHGHDHAGHSH